MHCGFSTTLPRLRRPARGEAARNQVTWPERHRSNRHDQGQGLRGAVREHSDGAVRHRATGPGPRRRPDPDPLLRRVPLRPAHGAQRVEEHFVSVRAGTRDRGSRGGGWIPGEEVQGRRHRGRGLPDRQLRPLPVLRRRARAVLRERVRRDLQRPGLRWRQYLWRLFADDRREGIVRAEDRTRREAARGGGTAALRRNHHLLAAAPLERRPGQDRRHRRASAASAIWA